MPKILFGGQSYNCDGVSILDCLAAHNVILPSSCKAGICQTCLMQATSGKVPLNAQNGLKPTLVEQGYFLACSCIPEEDMEISMPGIGAGKLSAKVLGIKSLNADIACIKLAPSRPLQYKAGQFINFFMDSSTTRSYSLASVPEIDDCIKLHVRKIPNGKVSTWIHEGLVSGEFVNISEAVGDCFYVPGKPEQGLLLIGTGSGLAPLYGIIQDALLQGHSGPINLYHGSLDVGGLYLVDELRRLSHKYPNFSYTPCVSEQEAPAGFREGTVLDVALTDVPNLAGWRIYLCGNPAMVNAAKNKTFFAGASMRDIFADPFLPAGSS
jgi:CDP-4-dehydro-6-deoxyglucose reductase, E3